MARRAKVDNAAPNEEPTKADQQLAEIARKLNAGENVPSSTPRTVLSWFDSSRRGRKRVLRVEEGLADHGLRTTPPLTETYIDGVLHFELLKPDKPESPRTQTENDARGGTNAVVDQLTRDRIAGYAVRRLRSANTPLVSIKPTASLQTLVTVMLTNDISQVPVMQTDYDLKGVVRWSSLGARLALGQVPRSARDCMEPATVIRASDDVFSVVNTITSREYALVQEDDKKFTGIVTTSDLSEILHVWAEPFLLIGEIENRVRSLIRPKFSVEDLKQVAKDETESIESVDDLAFGDYARLLQREENWSRLAISLDRGEFLKHMERVREIRNDVMHFDPERSDDSESDSMELKRFLKLLQQWRDMGLC